MITNIYLVYKDGDPPCPYKYVLAAGRGEHLARAIVVELAEAGTPAYYTSISIDGDSRFCAADSLYRCTLIEGDDTADYPRYLYGYGFNHHQARLDAMEKIRPGDLVTRVGFSSIPPIMGK